MLLLSLCASTAFAQGKGNSSLVLNLVTPTTPTGQRMAVPAMLLDDYDVLQPGVVSVTFGAGYSRVVGGHDVSLPFTDVSIGITRRFDVGVSSAIAKTEFEGFRTTAIGDSYINAKFVVLRESKHRPGIAFQPVLEILGRPSLAGNPLAPPKVNAAFGGIIGKSFGDVVRVYSHSGYFTRGIAFSTVALEIDTFSRITPTVFGGYGTLVANREVASSLLLNSSRPDVGGSLGVRISKNWSGYVSAVRSLGRRDANSIDISINGGISYSWRLFGE